jgi:hypothetical protein
MLSALTAVVLSAASFFTAEAASFTIFGTGVDGAGNVLPSGSIDPHFTINEVSANAQVVTPHPFYVPNSLTSAWIWERPDPNFPFGGLPGNVTRTFQTTFDLTGFDHLTAVINGAWATDKEGLEVRINGVNADVAPLLGLVLANFDQLHAFSITTGFVSGLNTLEFIVRDGGAPGGFRTDLSGTAEFAAVPLGGASPLFAVGLGLLGAAAWLRKRKARPAA